MIINNLTRQNHLHQVNQIFKEAKSVIIISPYITKNIELINFEELVYLRKVTIVTTLKPFDKDQYSKISYFKELYKIFNLKGVEFEILIDNFLHGKIFIGENTDGSAKAIITSANFTDRGLRINNEWGILIEDAVEIRKVKNGIIEKIKFKSFNEQKIDECLDKINDIPKPKGEINPIKLNLSLLFESRENYLQIETNATFWLKPIGVSHDTIPLSAKFDEVDSNLHFSKVKPRGVRRGDILICYAVGHLNILSVYRVNSELKNTGNENDRWPYYFVGENLTPNYGREWAKQHITITNQKNFFLQNTALNITPTGKNSFGSLMRGADKLKLTNEFGNFLMDKILKIDSDLEKL
ncbi:phospholipase D family protein [Flavobacterium defluvii]|uniref:PLD-like domain-containing protein n=1 Tax=Flavobacterium defluvii TaxID=370979 RepID=A0A1M5JE61_9FLAO|nr:phospholipase D family protein [Flavobacterium defluvii]SHG38655.1 PLD-like domain-containing protein [Flavobacterium defluvii]